MPAAPKITNVMIHMYKMGTGDCFVLKFRHANTVVFKMLIDCGCWTRKADEMRPFIETLKTDLEGHADVLVVTHEHTDHVSGFEAGKDLFLNDFTFDQIWMGWSEEEGDPKIDEWKKKYGERKMAIAKAANEIKTRVHSADYAAQYENSRFKTEIFNLHAKFSDVMNEFAALHVSGNYKGGLEGMRIVKEEIANNNLKCFKPGTVMQDIDGLPGIRIFVLGPPELYDSVKKEAGKGEESYDHNRDIDADDLLLKAVDFADSMELTEDLFPFEKYYETPDTATDHPMRDQYENTLEGWRKIDFDWLMSSGSLALRMNGLTNNLSLALAIQFVDSGKVILFPGDAEFGSWQSWHNIVWDALNQNGKPVTTQQLLNNTVFYKVAHHLSHNGTAKNLGLEMMTHKDMAAMATLDYNVISSGWKSTMPNRLIVKDLLAKTQGRLIIMNTDNLFYDIENQVPLKGKIDEVRNKMTTAQKKKFEADFDDSNPHYMEYIVRV